LQRAEETLARGDCQYASEIVGELEGEGHLDPAISELRRRIDDAIRRKTIAQLLDTAHSRMETEEYPLALQRIYEVLQLDPANSEAQSLKASIEHKRTERDLEEWFRLASQHLERSDFSHAREALQRLLQLRPKEGKALQLLSEVNRLEHEHTRARQEKEQLYQAAVAADQRGDVSAALSKLERVLDLDRRIPDAGNPERSTNYQNLYNKVRSEHESLQQAYAEAKQKLEAADFSAALAICTDQLGRYPDNALFQALKIDVAEQYRQALSARIAETDRKVDAEPDLDRRITILEDAVRNNPGERHFEQLLQRTRDKQKLIESIVLRARMHEQQSQFSEALSQWEIVKTIYDRYPGLTLEMERVVRRRNQHLRLEARNRWVEQVDRALEVRDYDRALSLLADAQAEHPGDSELAQLEKLARQGLEKTAEAVRLTLAGQAECSAGRQLEGLTILTRAYELDDRNPAVSAALRAALVERARGLGDSEPAAAEQCLRQALSIDPQDLDAMSLLSVLEDRRRQATVDRRVAEARQLQSQGDLEAATTLVGQGLETFPSEPRLVQLQNSLKKAMEERRRQEIEEANRQREATSITLDPPTLEPASTNLDDSTRVYTPESIPVQEPERIEPPPKPVEPKPPARSTPRLQLPGNWRLWGVGALAALVVGLLFVVVSRRSTAPPPPPIPKKATLEITTTPSGAAVTVNGKAVTLSPVELDPGSVTVEATLPGFAKATQTTELKAGARVPVALTLVPVLSLKLTLPTDGRVVIDNEEPVAVQDGQFARDFSPGTHNVRVSTGKSGSVGFAFAVRPDGPAAITEGPNSQQVTALLISNFGGATRIYTGAAAADVKLDGQSIGQVDRNGLDLPTTMTPGNHELAIGSGKDARKHSIEIGPERTLSVIVESDPNTGTLVVESNEDNAAISVFANGKPVKQGNTAKGSFRIANLKAGKYTVRAAKAGLDVDAGEQTVEVQKGEDKRVSFQFRAKPQLASVNIRLTPGSELIVDGISKGTSPQDTRVVGELTPASHTFVSQKGRQFGKNEKTIVLGPGQKAELDLRLSVLPVPVEIKKSPQGATVTYIRDGETTTHPFTGTRQDLPEGRYTFIADANGYLQSTAHETISWDTVHTIDLTQAPDRPPAKIADWGKGIWNDKGSYSERVAAGSAIFPKPLAYVQFTIRLEGGKNHPLWLLNYVNERNLVRCEINDEGFQAVRISDGKDPEILFKKSVAASQWYRIRIQARTDGAKIELSRGADWEVLGDIKATNLATTKFGFFVPEGRKLLMSDFTGRSFE
jgi:serine/threonine-protein kinase